jgi:CxxC-x17-CxxC domain-containing protein
MEFVDRFLKCSDCGNDFVFTAGEQLFFHERQFKNDPKRCKLCKAKRAGLGRAAAEGEPALPFSRTETRTECSACGIETTVPFKPTQGRPVLCRSCFQLKRAPAGIPTGIPSAVAAVAALDSPQAQVAAASAALDEALKAHGETTTAEAEATTMAQIAEAPAAVIAEAESVSEVNALEAQQAS